MVRKKLVSVIDSFYVGPENMRSICFIQGERFQRFTISDFIINKKKMFSSDKSELGVT